jgi:anti-sigma factor RsiW
MTESGCPITEEDLHAYIDGFLGAERRTAVERYLREHRDVAERVAAGNGNNCAQPSGAGPPSRCRPP